MSGHGSAGFGSPRLGGAWQALGSTQLGWSMSVRLRQRARWEWHGRSWARPGKAVLAAVWHGSSGQGIYLARERLCEFDSHHEHARPGAARMG